jgi:hypothetical protein
MPILMITRKSLALYKELFSLLCDEVDAEDN